MISAETLAELAKHVKYQNGAWAEVQRIARQYAMMKAHGRFIETNGELIEVNRASIEQYVEMFKENLLRAIERAFVEDALLGVALGEAK